MNKRICETKNKIKKAYLELLFKEEPNKIQVKEIVKIAKINRSTFYDRYGYLENLENEIIEEEMNNMVYKDIEIDALIGEDDGIDKAIIKKYINAFLDNKVILRYCTVENREKYIAIIAHKQVNLCASNLKYVTYYNAYFQCLDALSTLIEWINHPNGAGVDDIVDIVYLHSLALMQQLKK